MGLLLSYSTWGMPKVPIDVAVAHCAKLGFDGLELTVIPNWSTDAATLGPADRRRIRELYDQHNLALCGLTGNTPLLATDPDEHAANLERIRRLTGDLTPPREACTTWRALYLGLEELERELMDHIHLENNVLFKRALAET